MTLEEMLVRDEGLRLLPYKDSVGVLTIGVGRAIGRIGITQEEALYLLRNDIVSMQKKLAIALPWYVTLSPIRQLVLENMAFNLGVSGLLKFKNMLAAIKAEKFRDAGLCMLNSKYARQVGQRAVRLMNMLVTNEEP